MLNWLRDLAFFTLAACLGCMTIHVESVSAHESEQYTLPVGRDFADLGPYFTRIMYNAIVGAVAETNAAIEAAVESGRPAKEVKQLQSDDFVAQKVWEHIFAAIPTNELLDATLISPPVVAQYPGLVTMYRPVNSIYDDPLLVIDLTKVVRTFFRAGTVSAGGTIFGTDKIIHFFNIGRIYHAKYQTRLERGLPTEDAIKSAIQSTSRNPFLSEDGVLGMLSTGIVSNGDLAADYAGLSFYRNLTEEIRIGPNVLPPMLVRVGPLWHVTIRPDSGFFTAFITPHWNEALNPNTYARYTTGRLRALVRERCPDTLDRYRDEHGQRMSRDQFEAIERELSTYYGEFYDYEKPKHPVSIATVCFESPVGTSAANADPTAASAGPDAMGRSALWWAARNGDIAQVQRLAAQRVDLDSPDHDGESPLHAATRANSLAVVQELLARGAKPDVAALYGVTPLMLASAGSKTGIASLLLRAGARPNTRDMFGKTSLHDAVLRANPTLTQLLLDHGADPLISDDGGNTALHLAARSGNEAIVGALLARGGSARVRNATGATPRDEAKRHGHTRVAELLTFSSHGVIAAPDSGESAGAGTVALRARGVEPEPTPSGEPSPRAGQRTTAEGQR
jgi:hypothetical protein